MPVNMHAHSLFSIDGWETPEEVAERLKGVGVTTMALTDHNALGGLARARCRAEALGMRFITGVEVDVEWQDNGYHFLAFGFDPDHAGLRELSERQNREYVRSFECVYPLFEKRFGVDKATLRKAAALRYRTHPAPVLNKWLARAWLEDHGRFDDAESANKAMSKLVADAERAAGFSWQWSSFEAVRDLVHGAGGILLLAHVSYYLNGLTEQLSLLEAMLAQGMDGFELYHPVNTAKPHFDGLVQAARRWGCAVSGGADTHGDREPRTKPAPLDFSAPDWILEPLDAALARRGSA